MGIEGSISLLIVALLTYIESIFIYAFNLGSVLDCGFPKEFQLRDNSGNVYCANENGLVKGYDGLSNCDEDYLQTDKHKYEAISSLDNPNIPRNMCAIKSKYHGKYLEIALNGLRPLKVSNDNNLLGVPEKYFKKDEVNSHPCSGNHICSKKGKIINQGRLLHKVGASVHSNLIESHEICGVECKFSLKYFYNDPIITIPATNKTGKSCIISRRFILTINLSLLMIVLSLIQSLFYKGCILHRRDQDFVNMANQSLNMNAKMQGRISSRTLREIYNLDLVVKEVG